MIYQIYCFYNRKVVAYEKPILRLEDPNEMIETVHRDYKASEDAAKGKMEEYLLFHVGTFDDVKGNINTFEKNCILDLKTFNEKKEIGEINDEQRKA